MKSVSDEFATHIQGQALTLAACIEIIRIDGTAYRWTDHDAPLVVDGQTYLSQPGFTRAAISSSFDMNVSETEAQIAVDDDAIEIEALRAGLWDYATVRLFAVNWSDLGQGILRLRKGRIGQVTVNDGHRAKAELRGLAQNLQQEIVRVYTSECTADLGDARCRIPLRPAERANSTSYAIGDFMVVATGSGHGSFPQEGRIYECTTAGTSDGTAPTFSTSIDATTADGTVVWTAREAWSRPGTIDTVTSGTVIRLADEALVSGYADNWFRGGVLRWDTGANAGAAREILSWTHATRELTLFLNAPELPEAGDVVTIQPGCDKRITTCETRFDNRLNFRGFPHVPGVTIMTEFLWTMDGGGISSNGSDLV